MSKHVYQNGWVTDAGNFTSSSKSDSDSEYTESKTATGKGRPRVFIISCLGFLFTYPLQPLQHWENVQLVCRLIYQSILGYTPDRWYCLDRASLDASDSQKKKLKVAGTYLSHA